MIWWWILEAFGPDPEPYDGEFQEPMRETEER